MTELKNCPFCKAEPISENNRRFFLKHNPDCFLAHPLHNADFDIISTGSIADHIEAWNTRPAEDAKDKEIENLKAEVRKLAIELNNINILTDNIMNNANFESKATKAEMHSRLTSIYVYASHIRRALARTDNAPDTGKMEEK